MSFSLKTALRAGLPALLASLSPVLAAPPASGLTLLRELKGQAASHLVPAPDGSALYTTYTRQRGDYASVGSYRIAHPGDTLSALPVLIEPGLPDANALIAVAPSGKFLYVADETSRLYRFGIGANRTLTSFANEILPLPYEATGLAIDSAGRFLYVLVSQNPGRGLPGGESALKAYAVNDSSGALAEIPGSPFPVGSGAMGLAFAARGDIAIVSRWPAANQGLLTTYALDKATGALGSPIDSLATATKYPSLLALGHGGHLYVGQNPARMTSKPSPPDVISAYSVDPSGRLSALSVPPLKAGRLNCLTTSAEGSLLYACIDNTVRAYTMNPQTGALAQFASATVKAPRVWKAVTDTSGRIVYATDVGSTLSAYRVNRPQLSPGDVTIGADSLRFQATVSNIAAANVRSAGFFVSASNPPSPSDSSVSGTLNGASLTAATARARFAAGSTLFARPWLVTTGGALFLGRSLPFRNTPLVETFDVDTAFFNAALFKGASRLVQNIPLHKSNVRSLNFEICPTTACNAPRIEFSGLKSGGPQYGAGWPAHGASTGRDSALVFLGDLLKTPGTYYARATQTDSDFNVVYGNWKAFTYVPKLRTASPRLSLDSFVVKAGLAPGVAPLAAGVLMSKAAYFPALTQASYDTGFSDAPFTSTARVLRAGMIASDSFAVKAMLPGNPTKGLATDLSEYGNYHLRSWAYNGNPPRLVFGNLDSLDFQPSIKVERISRSADTTTVTVNVRIDPRVTLYGNDSAYVTCGYWDYTPAGVAFWTQLGFGPATRDDLAGANYWVAKFKFRNPDRATASCSASMDILKNQVQVPVNSSSVAVP